jgi:hypothetical protein
MYIIFADDARQNRPTRVHMDERPLVSIGGFAIDADQLGPLERSLDRICGDVGFSRGCEFKWSPPGTNWMAQNLIDGARREFFVRVLNSALELGAQAWVVVEDSSCETATGASCAEDDVLRLFLERVSNFLQRANSTGFIIADQPGGGRATENDFLLDCLELRERGSNYVPHDRLALSVVCAKSEFVRCVQLADLITSCTTARVAGERRFSPLVFEVIKPLLARGNFGRGGTGLKIHPDFLYRNLYHWLCGDTSYGRGWRGHRLPSSAHPYSNSEWE